jgi:hypothetical protein
VNPSTRRAILLTVAAVLIVAAGAIAIAIYLGPAERPSAIAASPTFTLARLDEHATCNLLVPTLDDATKPITAIVSHPDGSTVDKSGLDTAIKDLHTIRSVAPDDMVADIDSQIKPLETLQRIMSGGGNASIPLEEFRSSGLRLTLRCRKWAN